MGIRDSDVRRAGEAGVTGPAELIAALGLDDPGCCGRCAEEIESIADLACESCPDAGTPACRRAGEWISPRQYQAA